MSLRYKRALPCASSFGRHRCARGLAPDPHDRELGGALGRGHAHEVVELPAAGLARLRLWPRPPASPAARSSGWCGPVRICRIGRVAGEAAPDAGAGLRDLAQGGAPGACRGGWVAVDFRHRVGGQRGQCRRQAQANIQDPRIEPLRSERAAGWHAMPEPRRRRSPYPGPVR